MKKLLILIVFLAAVMNLMSWVTETATLEEFVYGHNDDLEYDNWLSHTVEGVETVDYNLYAPYDRQLTGFGNYEEPNTNQLETWHAITECITTWDYTGADDLLAASGLPFTLVEFNDTESGNTYWIIRENLNMNYIDDNGTPDWDGDDERGSFDYGWGLYIFNPMALYPVIVTTPHINDDYPTLPVSLAVFRETGAYALMANGTGREVYWDNPYNTGYANSYSLCDPTRQEDTVFNQVYQASCDYLRTTFGHRELCMQIHSYDWNRHQWYSSNQISAGWGKDDPGVPIRDYSEYGLDIFNQSNEWVFPANALGNHPAIHLNDYYAVNCSTYPITYSNGDTTFAVNTTIDLPGYRYNRQMVYTDAGMNDHLTFEPFFHIEMDELPNCYPQTQASYYWFWGYDPVTQRFDYDHLFDKCLTFFMPWVESVAAAIPPIFANDDGVDPTSCSPLEIVSVNYDRVELTWQKTNCYDYLTYEVLYSEEPIANGNYDIWDRSNDQDMNSAEGNWTEIWGLDQNTEYYFEVRVLDANGNYSEPSNEVALVTSPARLRYEKAVGDDGFVTFSFNAYRQDENAGFLIYRKAADEMDYSLQDSYETNPELAALNDSTNYNYYWVDTDVNNWTEYSYIAASTDSSGNEYWHNYPATVTPFDLYTINFTCQDTLTDYIMFGASPEASNGYDTDYDVVQDSTPAGTFVFAEFYEEDWDNNQSMIREVKGGYNFDSSLKSWVFRVRCSQQYDNVITVEASGEFIRDGRKLYLFDQSSGQLLDLVDNDYNYEYASANTGWRYFTLYWGNIIPDVEFNNPANSIYQAGDVANFSWTISNSFIVENFDVYLETDTDQILLEDGMLPFLSQVNWTVPEGLLLENARIILDLLMIDGDRRQYTSSFRFGCVPSAYTMTLPAGFHLLSNPYLDESSINGLLGDAELYTLENEEYEQDAAFLFGTGYFAYNPLGHVTMVESDIAGGNEQFNLQPGWNIVPNPHMAGHSRDGLRIITPNLDMSFTEAVQYGLIESAIYTYDEGWHEVDYIYPTESFLLYCHQSDLQIKFIPYNINQDGLITEQPEVNVIVTAMQGTGIMDGAVLALNGFATEDYDKLYDLPEPYLTPGDEDLNFYTVIDSAESGLTKLNQQTRGSYDLSNERMDWNFEVTIDQLETVTFSLMNSDLPEDVVVKICIDGDEHDLTRNGDYIYEPVEHTISGELSFVPLWMAEDENTVPQIMSLLNYPNPFYYGETRSDGIKISYALPEAGKVKLSVYNIKGQKVIDLVDDHIAAGKYETTWDLRDKHNRPIASGVYFSRLETEKGQKHSKLVIIK